jgi:hypothetical protein
MTQGIPEQWWHGSQSQQLQQNTHAAHGRHGIHKHLQHHTKDA